VTVPWRGMSCRPGFAVVLVFGDEEVRMTERTVPEGLSDERGLLDGWLEYYRATLLAKC
jgi:hypothetical protein